MKSNIGHALTAAGAAGLLKVLLALEHRVLPPTANFESPAPRARTGREPVSRSLAGEPWPAAEAGQPRRAAVSGFGFGGINAHVLIEEWTGSPGQSRRADAARVRARHWRIDGPDRHRRAERPVRLDRRDWRHSASVSSTASRRRRRRLLRAGGGSPKRAGFAITIAVRGRFDGLFIDELEFRVDQFRIPPSELVEMLPQQSLMLKVAAEACQDARWDDGLRFRPAC